MNYPLTMSGQVRAAASLAEAVADRHGCVGIIGRTALGTAALLDQAERELSLRRIRCVRVQGVASGGLSSRGLIAQIVARPDPDALTDAELKAGFMALTEPGEGFRRVALLVSEAHSLRPSALRYVQLARQATPAKLCVVLAGQPGLATALADEDLAPLRSAMHMMSLSEPEEPGLFDRASAMPEPPAAVRAGSSSSLARLGLAALIVPLVGLIWWRHLPAVPAVSMPSQDAPGVSTGLDAPSVPDAAGTPGVPSAIEPPVAALAAPPPAAVPVEGSPVERPGEPAPPEPAPVTPPQAEADLRAADPAPPVATATVPESPAPEAPPAPQTSPASETSAKPETPAESSADAAPPPAATELPAAVAAEPAATATEPSATAAEPPATPPERSEGPAEETVAEPPAPRPAAPDVGSPMPEPAAAAKPPPPPPHGTLTVTTAPAAHGGTRRAIAPVAIAPAAVPQAAAPPVRRAEERPREDRPNLADERRCRDIVLKAQLGKDPSDADKQFLRSGCRSG